MIAEKRKAAEAIAGALGPHARRTVNGVTTFHVKSLDVVVLPLRGHLKAHGTVPEYEKWGARDPREIITNPKAVVKRTLPGQYKLRDALRQLGQSCNACVVGTDADLEGCNIGLMDALPEVKSVNPRVRVSQLWLSTLQKRDVVTAWNNLVSPKWSWAEAAEARSLLDAVIGFSATREITLSLKALAKRLGAKVFSIGRVQTSLLYLLFLRERGVRNFKPKPYHVIKTRLLVGATKVPLEHEANPFYDWPECEASFKRVESAKVGVVRNFLDSTRERKPPTPLNTTKALLLLTRHLKASSARALQVMEDLYLDQLLSYPRTDSDAYDEKFDHRTYLAQLSGHSRLGRFASALLSSNRVVPTKGKVNAGDHAPITPVASAEDADARLKSDLHRKVYYLLARHYLSLFFPPAKERKAELRVAVNGEPFIGKVVALVDPGFLEVLPELSPTYDPWVACQAGRNYPVDPPELEQRETKPPPRFNDTSVIALMERHGLGTKSTRPDMVETLLKRGYVKKVGRVLHVTALGYDLMENLEPVWRDFLLPAFTARVERELEAIKEGKKTRKEVVDQVKAEFLALFDAFRRSKPAFVEKMNGTEAATQGTSGSAGKVGSARGLGVRCPTCGQEVQLVRTPRGKRIIKCADAASCKFVLFLPKAGWLTPLSEKCQKCGFPAIKVTKRSKGRYWSYIICPQCWNASLGKKGDDSGFCPKCSGWASGSCPVAVANAPTKKARKGEVP